MKFCNKCKTTKTLLEFRERGDKKGLESHCRVCKTANKRKWYKNNKTLSKTRFYSAIGSAKRRKLNFNLSESEYSNLILNSCFYCKVDISKEVGIGLDRINNSIGYSKDNVVPCCGSCNSSRGDRYTSEEWLIMINALIKYKSNRSVTETSGSSKSLDTGSNPVG